MVQVGYTVGEGTGADFVDPPGAIQLTSLTGAETVVVWNNGALLAICTTALIASLAGSLGGLITNPLPALTAGTGGLGASATNGGQFYGSGSVNDLWFGNKNGTAALTLATGTVSWTMPAQLTMTYTAPSAQIFAIAPTGNLSATPSGITPRTFSARGVFTGNITEASLASYNRFLADNDIANANSAQGGGSTLVYMGHTLGTGFKGGRTTLGVLLNYVGTSGNGTPKFYVGLGVQSIANVTDGGTSMTGLGSLFGQLTLARLQGTATFWNSLVGLEVDTIATTGTSVSYKRGIKVVSWNNDVVRGTIDDFAFGIGMVANAGATAGYAIGFQFGDASGWWPTIDTLIGTAPTFIAGGNPVTALKGIAFAGVTFSTSAWELTGATLDPSGNWTAVSVGNGATALKIGGAGSWTANGSVATALSSVGPTGSHTTVQEWLTFKDASGTTRYIPAF